MICVTVEIREGTRGCAHAPGANHRPLIERVLELAADGKPGRRVRLHFPIHPEAYFVPEGPGQKKAA